MRQSPLIPYTGVTIVLSNPSRFDIATLISAHAGHFFEHCIKPTNRFAFDIRTLDCKEPYVENTKVILACGTNSLGLCNNSGGNLDNLRGSPFLVNGVVVIPTYLPQDCVDRRNFESSLNPLSSDYGDDEDDVERDEGEVKDKGRTSRSNYRFWFERDVRKALDISRNGYKPNVCNYIVSPPSGAFIDWCRQRVDETIYLDIETNPLTQQILCFTVSSNEKETWTIPCITYNGELAYDRTTLAKMFRSLCSLMANNSVCVHNSLFDLFILCHSYKLPPPARIYDTMVAQHRIFTEPEKSLGHCISMWTHEIYHKDEGCGTPMSQEQDRQLWQYNAKDVERLAQIHIAQTEYVRNCNDKGLSDSVAQGNDSLRVYLLMMMRGIKLDNIALCAHIDSLTKREEFFENKILSRLVGYKLNPRSPPQVANYLYNELKLPEPKDDKTNKKNLFKLALSHEIPALKVILALRKWRRERSQISFNQWQEGRVTCHYKVTGTKTFRLSSSTLLRYKNRKETGWGTNIQNWRKDKIRYLCVPDIFVPSPLVFIQCDQAGAEALIVAYECKTGNKLRQLFDAKVKPHTYIAMQLFPKHWMGVLPGLNLVTHLTCPISELKNQEGWKELANTIKESDHDIPSKRFYYMAKQTVHSSNYDIKGPTFVMNILDKSDGEVVVPLAEGNRFLKLYHSIIPEIREWHEEVKNQLRKDRTIRNLFGYPRKFYGPIDFSSDYDSAFKEAYAQNPQSTVGTITNIAATNLQAGLDAGIYETEFAILQNNHDSLLVQCHREDDLYVANLLQQELSKDLVSTKGEKFKMGSEVSVGLNWAEMEEINL